MFRRVSTVALVVAVAVGSCATATAAEPKPAPTKQITNSIGVKLTLVPSGEFKMGSGESAEATAAFFDKTYGPDGIGDDRFEDEHPRHRVWITRAFYLGTYHVTRGQFRRFVKETAYITGAEKGEQPALGWVPAREDLVGNAKFSWRNPGFEQTDDHPVVIVSRDDALAFCEWLSRKEGRTYRLPTEAEWEYACRGGTTTRYSSGDDPETLAKVANVADATIRAKFPKWKHPPIKASDGYMFTSPVGSFKPNAFGLYDMHGNAWQWCADRYSSDYYAKSPVDDPSGPHELDLTALFDGFVVRGGSWREGPLYARSAARDSHFSRESFGNVGFRVACERGKKRE
jgi:formylglycine-generating enzyme required for sulfatase activity